MGKVRKSQSYYKDHKTGYEVEVEREKPVQQAKGIITVSVFDEDGNIVQEAKTENIIHPHFEYNGISGLYSMFGEHGQNSFYGYLDRGILRRIVLTNSSAEESDKVCHIQGEALANQKLITNMNYGESGIFIEDGTIRRHIVMDYQTNESNGTFQSIYWTHMDNYDNTYLSLHHRAFPRSFYKVETETMNSSTYWNYLYNVCYDNEGNAMYRVFNINTFHFDYYPITNLDEYVFLMKAPKKSNTKTHRTMYQTKEGNYLNFKSIYTPRESWNIDTASSKLEILQTDKNGGEAQVIHTINVFDHPDVKTYVNNKTLQFCRSVVTDFDIERERIGVYTIWKYSNTSNVYFDLRWYSLKDKEFKDRCYNSYSSGGVSLGCCMGNSTSFFYDSSTGSSININNADSEVSKK